MCKRDATNPSSTGSSSKLGLVRGARIESPSRRNLRLVEEPFIKPWMIDLADDHYELEISRDRALLDWDRCARTRPGQRDCVAKSWLSSAWRSMAWNEPTA